MLGYMVSLCMRPGQPDVYVPVLGAGEPLVEEGTFVHVEGNVWRGRYRSGQSVGVFQRGDFPLR